MRREVIISLCDKSAVMVTPWAEDGFLCICVDIAHSISATRKRNHKIKKFASGGEIHFVWGDARSWKPEDFDKNFFQKYIIRFMSAFPTCTNLAGSGSQYFQMKGIPMLSDALGLFNYCEQIASYSGSPYCIENPVGVIPSFHRKPDYYFNPWNYGEDYQKKTCLWTGNGFIMPDFTCIEKPDHVTEKIIDLSPSKERNDIRSETPLKFAQAVYKSNC